ncbi:MAG: DUF6788 family protein [Salinibacter sp.]
MPQVQKRFNEALNHLEREFDTLDSEIRTAHEQLEGLIPHASLHFKYVKCRSDCQCNDGNGHGPYAYASYRDHDGRVRTRYMGKDPDLPEGSVDRKTWNRMQRELARIREKRQKLWSRVEDALALLERG